MISVLALVAIGVTNAFFSDTETSKDNRFEAGKIDLKVDHFFASYNGRDCTQDCVEQETNLLTDGGFENPEVTSPENWDIFDSPAGGWTVEWRGDITATYDSQNRPITAKLELHEGVLGPAFEGDQYAELDTDWNGHSGTLNNEPASVTIYQDISTDPGKKYKLRFHFAPRPNTSADENVLEVKWDGAVIDTIGPIAGGGSIVWQEYVYDVTASGNTTRLQFTDLGTASSLGTFLDNVILHEVVCQEGIGELQCHLWQEKDLEKGDFIWNFEDVKPGDYGRNVFSLHVYDNNAYACIFPEWEDLENDLVDPEAEAGDVTQDEGELSQFLDLFVWREEGEPDGIYDPPTEEEVHDSFFDVWVDVAVPPNDPLTASTTYYYGIAWCIGNQSVDHNTGLITCDGTGDQNIAQTDTLEAILNFYAEQSRRNENFSCRALVSTPTPTDEP